MTSQHTAECRRAVLELLADVDPMGLVAMGAPRDEYRLEVPDLLRDAEPTPGRVQEVFRHWFTDIGEVSHHSAVRISDGIARIRRDLA